MRETTSNGKKITYPDKLTFAFNPNPIIVETDEAETFVFAAIGGTYTDKRDPFNGKVSLDAARYMQMFVGKDRRQADIVVTVAGASLTFDVIWGVINIGEKFNASRRLYWYTNLPFTFNVYVPDKGKLEKKYKTDGTYTPIEDKKGLVELSPNELFSERRPATVKMTGGEEFSVFEYTFDYTFVAIDGNSCVIELIPVECTDGVYLRWVDRHGFIQYRLFDKGVTSDKSSVMGETLETDYTDEMPRYGVKVYQAKGVERSMKLGAAGVDAEEFERLKMLDSAAVVDLYVNGKWVPVRIKAATVKTEGSHLFDYECEMILPDIISQSL